MTVIEPGRTQKVVVNIPTKYIRSRDLYTKDIEVETNDKVTPIVRLTMKLKVMDVLVITPQVLNFGDVKPKSVNSREIVITNKSKEPVTLTKITAFPDTVLGVSHAGDVKLDPGKSVTVMVTYKPSAPENRFLGLFQIETTLEELKVKTVQVRASVEGK